MRDSSAPSEVGRIVDRALQAHMLYNRVFDVFFDFIKFVMIVKYYNEFDSESSPQLLFHK